MNFILNAPRGRVFRHVNLLVPPKPSEAQSALIIMEPEDTPPMSASNSICVAKVLPDTGILQMTEPESHLLLEAPGGLDRVRAECRDGKAQRTFGENLTSFSDALDATLEIGRLGKFTVDTPYGGDSCAIVDAGALGFALTPDAAHDIARLGKGITAAATGQRAFEHRGNPDWRHRSQCLFAGKLSQGP